MATSTAVADDLKILKRDPQGTSKSRGSKKTPTQKYGSEKPLLPHVLCRSKMMEAFEDLLKAYDDRPHPSRSPQPQIAVIGDDLESSVWTKQELTTLALDYYNSKQDANFKLVRMLNYGVMPDIPRWHFHINFVAAEPNNVRKKLFYSEMHVPYRSPCSSYEDHYRAEVRGCCVLKKVNSGNRKARPCVRCHGVKHPTFRYGYCSESGDFANPSDPENFANHEDLLYY